MNDNRINPQTDDKSVKFDGAGACAEQTEGASTPTVMTNAEIRESGAMPEIIKAMEHDVSDIPDADPAEVLEAIECGVVGTYQKIEDGVVGAYQKIEDGVVGAYKKVENRFVERFLTKEGESVEEAKARLAANNHKAE